MGIIRESRQADGPVVYALICEMEARLLPEKDFAAIYAGQLESENYACLVYEEEGKTVGCINLRMEKQLHHAERICEIMEFAVQSGYRSKGIGRSLFEAACRYAHEQDCSQIEVCCNQLRHRTHKFYEAMGMHNFHYKFSLRFGQSGDYENELGR